jgi:hypothetical protein
MDNTNIKEKIRRHMAFWNRENVDRPLIGYLIGSYFPVQRYEEAKRIFGDKKLIKEDIIIPENFIGDYERLFEGSTLVEQDAFWVAEPFTGIPWMEAFLGCSIFGSKDSMWAEPWVKDIKDLEKIKPLNQNTWYKKYNQFTSMLVDRSDGRFPVGQPILRGISDIIGALVGQSELVYYFYDEPEMMKKICMSLNEMFLQVVQEQQDSVPKFLGGHSIGFYDIWCPGKCIWFQEDLTSLLSPEIYRQFILECNRITCSKYEYSAIHLHPSSFYLIDDLLEIDGLKAIEINMWVDLPF